MKKEVLIAIIVGFGLGLAITFGIYTAQTSLKQKQQTPPAPSPSPETTAQEQKPFLTLSQPEDQSITDQDTAEVSGITEPDAVVIILSQADQVITTADSQGAFAEAVDLESGLNTILVQSYDNVGNQNSVEHTLVYSTQFDQSANTSESTSGESQ